MGAILMTISGTGGPLEELIGELNAAGAQAELNATADGARGLSWWRGTAISTKPRRWRATP